MTHHLIQTEDDAIAHRARQARAVLDAMVAAVTDGSYHTRTPLDVTSGPMFERFVDIGLAMRQMWVDPEQQTALIDRLRPFRGMIIGGSPTAIQPHGLLPRGRTTTTRLDDVGDDELREWFIEDNRLIYGEFTEMELANYLDSVAPYFCTDGQMYDLGSGLGKVVLTTALTMPFERCTGVELLPYRHALAVERRDLVLRARDHALAALGGTLTDDVPLVLPSGVTTTAAHVLNFEDRVHLAQGDMFQAELTDPSLVFMYSTCFSTFIDRIAAKLARDLPSGCLVTTTTYELPHPAFRLVREFPADTLAWTTVYAYRREGKLDRLPPPPAPSVRHEPDAEEWEAGVRAQMAEQAAR
ncbi:hypothetical protein MMAD_15330 [Mycolicibacterium madagascariense]|uniref:DOT1 domain-containing protein n=1 Tax=Mycolicibacterium madagascariense TaxID=212765 RepID=A0A7I7XEF9_9MYCO|nr:histone methylation protein DOT1-like protein [Mycolicibacterium madagascariense]MCV7014446.1 histone methylation protein DOT1-like protein [Mycolicibacterium madagascariense]BBZ27238.1 hypothetical protein MMAD_15330 [Mycolicibacterium madagascariense]